ncbi:zinc-binding protein A33-like [Rhinichthys klamathensis goyatoka]|uniref:zinc-binding protein A33-like n=1 Tax=Rhinichthys klamathensis goyatoka TaxID=3034132 RepID=UPI0024B4E55E|nr:zinc-binding protein A33-like [Rhinichthys klamathensis goyatoka]
MLHKCRFATGLTFSSDPLTEELQCSVCLDVFTDPVTIPTIPCGHNFCKSCLNQCWDKSEACCCPLCKETFNKRPDLKINTALRRVVQLFKEKSCLTKPDVLCDICDERKLKALKSCLICQSSYCETHLEPHQRVPRLKKHKLINTVENLEDYICQKHERPLEMFCRDDQTFVCLFCTDGDHKTHNTVPLEEESEEKKTQVMKIQTEVQQIIQDRMKKIQDIKHSAELRKAQKVGVFVDYEGGLVSFYDMKSRSHNYSFTGQTFTEKLFPYFFPSLNKDGKNSAPLIISPIN